MWGGAGWRWGGWARERAGERPRGLEVSGGAGWTRERAGLAVCVRRAGGTGRLRAAGGDDPARSRCEVPSGGATPARGGGARLQAGDGATRAGGTGTAGTRVVSFPPARGGGVRVRLGTLVG